MDIAQHNNFIINNSLYEDHLTACNQMSRVRQVILFILIHAYNKSALAEDLL
jgi:hypothetical protein